MRDVTIEHVADHLLANERLRDRDRLEEEQQTPRQILIRIMRAGDVMDEVMAECHHSEGFRAAGIGQLQVFEPVANPRDEVSVVRIRRTVDQDGPVDVARFRDLSAPNGAKDHDRCVFRREAGQRAQLLPQRCRPPPCLGDVRPGSANPTAQLVDEGVHAKAS